MQLVVVIFSMFHASSVVSFDASFDRELGAVVMQQEGLRSIYFSAPVTLVRTNDPDKSGTTQRAQDDLA
jgi:hypothetical protein